MLEKRNGNSRLATLGAADDAVSIPSPRGGGGRVNAAPILEVLWRRRWILVACVALSLAGAAIYLARAVPIYASSSQIYIEQSRPKIMGEAVSSAAISTSYLFTQCELIKSTAVLSEAVQSPAVDQVKSIGTAANRVGFLKSVLNVQVSKQGDIISVAMESRQPEDAAILVNAVVDAYIANHNAKHKSTATEVVNILKSEKKAYEAEYKTYSDKMLAFLRENGTLSFEGDKGNIVVQRLSELSNALTKAQLETLETKITMDSANAFESNPVRLQQFLATLNDRAVSGVPGAAARPEPVAEIQQLRRRIDVMKRDYGPNFPPLQSLIAQLRQLEDESRQSEGQLAEGQQAALSAQVAIIREQYAKAKRREEALQQDFEAQRRKALDLNAKAAEYGQMATGARRAEQLLNAIELKIKELRVDTENADAFNTISVMEPAKPVYSPVRPDRAQILGIGLVIGLMVGVGGALVQDWTDQRLRSAEEIASLLDLPVLGTIPHIIGKQTPSERGQEIHLHPRSDVAEAYRTVRTAIYFGVPDADSKTILVTSPSPGDGKSTVTSNLALAIAQANRRVLLIDADCRKPVQHRSFGLQQELGLSSVLLGHATPEAAIQKTGAENLDILPCGPLPTNPAEMLNSHRMGLEDLVTSVVRLRERVPDVRVVIAGKGPLRGPLEQQIAALGLTDHVQLLGFVPDELLPVAYRAADLSVVPTTALEGFGLVAVESLAAGTPVLVTPVGGLPEVVRDLSPALVLPRTGSDALADGMIGALRGDLALPTEAACRSYARDRYDWERIARRTRAVYDEVAV